MKTWFTADTHFGSNRTLELSKRPFINVYDMDRQMINNWNKVISKDDTIYHLGDFGDYTFRERLNGNIVLLFGNYERDDWYNGVVTEDKLIEEYGFKDVLDLPNWTLDIGEYRVDLVHEPSLSHNEDVDSDYYLFGHIHKTQMIKRNGLNVGVDVHNFTPIDEETVLFYINAIRNHYDEEVFMN